MGLGLSGKRCNCRSGLTRRVRWREGKAMTDTIEPMTRSSLRDGSERGDQQQIARQLVDRARGEGLELIGPDGLLTGLTKTVLETALKEELSAHLGYDKHDRPAGTARTPATGPEPRRC
jgi:putative transposase